MPANYSHHINSEVEHYLLLWNNFRNLLIKTFFHGKVAPYAKRPLYILEYMNRYSSQKLLNKTQVQVACIIHGISISFNIWRPFVMVGWGAGNRCIRIPHTNQNLMRNWRNICVRIHWMAIWLRTKQRLAPLHSNIYGHCTTRAD